MSVINQMLKDLDNRQASDLALNNAEANTSAHKSNATLIGIVVIVLLLVVIIGGSAWQLYLENDSLKQQIIHKEQHAQMNQNESVHTKNINDNEQPEKVKPVLKAIAKTVPIAIPLDAIANKQVIDKTLAPQAEAIEKIAATAAKDEASIAVTPDLPRSPGLLIPHTSQQLNTQDVGPVVSQKEWAEVQFKPKATLSISRRQLSPKELATQKFTQAEQAMANNELEIAATLFEDILLVVPEHKNARVQLAALWFGKKEYQSALNLLSQGMNITPADGDYRLMAAKILLTLDKSEQALKILAELPTFNQVEYQSLLATTAQRQQQFGLAIIAYKQLTQMQPKKGKWWLGLAIAYDSGGQFNNALTTYQLALAQGNVSESTATFIHQRLSELGE